VSEDLWPVLFQVLRADLADGEGELSIACPGKQANFFVEPMICEASSSPDHLGEITGALRRAPAGRASVRATWMVPLVSGTSSR